MHPQMIARLDPQRVATVMAGTGEEMTYGTLDGLSRSLAAMFGALGLKYGDHIALLVDNEIMYHPLCWGAWYAGLYFTPISTRLTAAEVRYMTEDSGAQLLVASPSHAETVRTLRAEMPQMEHWYLTGPGDGDIPDIKALATTFAPKDIDEDTKVGVDMLYSSGTTGRPKGIKPRFGATSDEANPLASLLTKLYGFDETSRYLTPAPLYHGSPTKFSMAVHRAGGTNVIMEKFDAAEALLAIDTHRVTHSQWVPTMLHRMARLPKDVKDGFDLSSHRVAVHAAAPCAPELKRDIITWWGAILYEFYAGSEAIGFTSITTEEWLDHPGSVGRAVLGDIHIIGEDGEEVGTGETGEIFFANGPAVEYHNDPVKTAKAYNADGWATLGDIGRLDEEGYLFLSDRKDFMIISGGVNVYPAEIEQELIMHPEVDDVAVFGIPNAEFGEEVKAIVQPGIWPDDEEAYKAGLIAWSRLRLSPIKVPRSIDLQRALPRHPNGKLYKTELRQKYLTERQAT